MNGQILSKVRKFVETILDEQLDEKLQDTSLPEEKMEEMLEEKLKNVPSQHDVPTYKEVTNLIDVKATSREDVRKILQEESNSTSGGKEVMEEVESRLREFQKNLPGLVEQTIDQLFSSLADGIAGATEPSSDSTEDHPFTDDEARVIYAIEELHEGEGETEISFGQIEDIVGPVGDEVVRNTITKLQEKGWVEDTDGEGYELTKYLPEETRKRVEKSTNPA